MQFLWQQRVLLLVSTLLSATPSPAVASSFVLPSTAMKSTAFKKARYNPLLHVSAGGDDSAPVGDSQEGGVPSEPVAADTTPAPVPIIVPAPVPDIVVAAAASTTTTTVVSFLGPKSKSPPGFLRSKVPGFAWHRLPDWLTYARCLAIPVFVALFYADLKGKSHLYTGTIFAFASVTDWLDGYLARRWDISTACE